MVGRNDGRRGLAHSDNSQHGLVGASALECGLKYLRRHGVDSTVSASKVGRSQFLSEEYESRSIQPLTSCGFKTNRFAVKDLRDR